MDFKKEKRELNTKRDGIDGNHTFRGNKCQS